MFFNYILISRKNCLSNLNPARTEEFKQNLEQFLNQTKHFHFLYFPVFDEKFCQILRLCRSSFDENASLFVIISNCHGAGEFFGGDDEMYLRIYCME